ncbi:hypothetical protein [Methanogenium marinum]|nr:hypothetical protein [Methanogenium marinum]
MCLASSSGICHPVFPPVCLIRAIRAIHAIHAIRAIGIAMEH